jgi:predicted phage terminase large subunit-like protein
MTFVSDIDPLADLDAYIDFDPENALIELDRQIVKEGGLSAFTRLAWPIVEGAEASYQSNWHLDAINEHLEAVSNGEIKRLAIAVPPRHSKSLSTAVMWPAFDWVRRPWRRFLYASYAHNLSIRDSVRCRRIVQSEWYEKRWGHRFKITSDQNTKIRFDNDKNGYRLSTSVDGQLTGEGGDIIVVDDPHNVRKAESETTRESTLTWWNESMSTRLNDPKSGAYVLIQQRVHQGDLMGSVLRQESIIPWTILCLPAEFEPNHPQRWIRDPRKEEGELLWPQRNGPKEIAELKQRLGPYASAGQLQQRPAPREGGIFKRKWFGTPIKVAPADTVFVRGWDFAGTEKKMVKSDPDYTAGAKVGWSQSQQIWIIAHINRFREEPHEVEASLKLQAERDGIGVQIQLAQDPGQAGKSQIKNFMKLLSRYSVFAEPVTGDKMARALTWAGKAGAGMVKLLEDDSWNEDFLQELTGFPTAAHDDQVDAVSSAFDRLLNNTFGIMGFMEQQLIAAGIDPASLKTPSQLAAEKAAEAEQKRKDEAAKAAANVDVEALARSMLRR